MGVGKLDSMAKKSAKDIVRWAEGKELPDVSQLMPLVQDFKLTPERRKLLAIMALPQAAEMNVVQLCDAAGVSRIVYYGAMKDPEFQAMQAKLARSLISSKTLRHLHKYDEIAMGGDRQALERLMTQQGTLDPETKRIDQLSVSVNADLTELLALIKEQQIDSEDISDLVDVLEGEIVEGSTVGEGEVTRIPQENIGPSLSEKNKNGSHPPESPDSEKNNEEG